MQLTRTERWTLANQCKILETLYPDEAEVYAGYRRVLERGYELRYPWICESIYGAPDTMSSAECQEVLDILQMFSDIHHAWTALEDKTGIDGGMLAFRGFDGNNETKQMGYCRFLCSLDGGRFPELHHGHDGFNSHSPVLECYRRMLSEWRKATDHPGLTRDELARIATAAVHPENRT